MGPFVEDPIKAGAVGQDAEPAILVPINRKGRQIDGSAFVVEGIGPAGGRLGRVVVQPGVVGIGDAQLGEAAPFSLDQFVEPGQGPDHRRMEQNILGVEGGCFLPFVPNGGLYQADQLLVGAGTPLDAAFHPAGGRRFGFGVAAAGGNEVTLGQIR